MKLSEPLLKEISEEKDRPVLQGQQKAQVTRIVLIVSQMSAFSANPAAILLAVVPGQAKTGQVNIHHELSIPPRRRR